MYYVKSKSGKLLEIRDTKEKLEKTEKNERKLETLCSRVNLCSENSLNSFEKLQYLLLEHDSFNFIEIEKASIETKLSKPYNLCKKSSVDEPCHKWIALKLVLTNKLKKKIVLFIQHISRSRALSNVCSITGY